MPSKYNGPHNQLFEWRGVCSAEVALRGECPTALYHTHSIRGSWQHGVDRKSLSGF